MKSSARAAGIGVILLLTSMAFWPLARAEDVRVEAALSALPIGATRYDKLANLANVSDQSLSNYNQTWAPFFDKYSDLKGVTVTPLTIPAIIQYPATTLRVAQRITFTAEQIMSGSSVSWWRSPIGNASTNTTVKLQIWRVDSTTNNITALGTNGPVFQKPSEANLIYNYTGLPWQGPNYTARTFAIPVKPIASQTQWTNLSGTLEDSTVWKDNPTVNYGTATEMYASQEDSTVGITRMPVRWGNGAIPAGSFIIAANLSFAEIQSGAPIVNGSALGAYGITSPWTESGVTWNNQPMTQGTPDSTVLTQSPVARISWNVTKSYKSGFDTAANRGVMLKYVTEAPPANEWTIWGSSENVTLGQRPTLWVRWAPSSALYNFSYVAVRAPIFSAKNYIAFWQFSGAVQRNYHLYYSENDVAQDGIYDSWVKKDSVGSTVFVPADLDQSVVFTRGMSNGIGGIVPDCSFYYVTCVGVPEVAFSFTTSHTIGPAIDPSFLNFLFPVRDTNVSGTDIDIEANVILHFSSGGDGGLFTRDIILKSTNALAFASWNLTAELGGVFVGRTIKQVNVTLSIVRDGLRFWLSAKNVAPWTNLTLFLASTDSVIPFRFALYGYFSVDKFYFTNTEKNIVLIPEEEPATALGKLQLFQRWKASIQSQATTASPLNCAAQLESKAWAYIFSAGTKVLTDLINHDQCLTDAILAGLGFITSTLWNVLEPIFGPIGAWLFKIGSWIWENLSFIIKAIEWFLFWTVKFINVFLVGVVFSIIFIASNYVGKAVYEWVKSGYQTDVLKSILEDGWERVSDLVKLLIAFATIAIAAIAAVIPL